MRVLGVAMLVSAVAASTVACREPTHQYLSDPETGMFISIPLDWEMAEFVRQDPSVTAPIIAERLLFPAGSDLPDGPWTDQVAFPYGYILVVGLTEEQQDVVSLRTMRNLVLDIDGLLATSPGTIDLVETQRLSQDGFRGERLTFNLRHETELGTVSTRVTQLTYLDPLGERTYTFMMACSTECADANDQVIQGILSSWRVAPA